MGKRSHREGTRRGLVWLGPGSGERVGQDGEVGRKQVEQGLRFCVGVGAFFGLNPVISAANPSVRKTDAPRASRACDMKALSGILLTQLDAFRSTYCFV